MELLDDGVPPEDLPYLVVDSLASADASLDSTVSSKILADCQVAIQQVFQNFNVIERGEIAASALVNILKNASPKMLSTSSFSTDILPKISLLLESMSKLHLKMTQEELSTLTKFFTMDDVHVKLRTAFAASRTSTLPETFCLADLLATTDAEFCGVLKCQRVEWDRFLLDQQHCISES